MVSVARRNLFQDRTRLAISLGGVAFALLLVLVLDGIFAGAMQKISAYIDSSQGQVFVAQDGVRNMHMTTSSLRLGKARQVAQLPGVATVAPILYSAGVATAGEQRAVIYVIGFDPDDGGGPWQMVAGTAALQRREVVVDRGLAARLGLELGDTVEVLGEDFTIAGLSEGGTSLANSLVFIRRPASVTTGRVGSGQGRAEQKGNVQEVNMTASAAGYSPNVISVKQGVPLRINITTDGSAGCARQIVFPTQNIYKLLPVKGTTTVEFTPNKSGQLSFSCTMGMFGGMLLVE